MAPLHNTVLSFPAALKQLRKLALHLETFPISELVTRGRSSKIHDSAPLQPPPPPPRVTRSISPRPLRLARWHRKKPMPPISRVQDGRVEKRWPDSLRYRLPVGLHNPSCFCYRRAMLQCLLHLPIFYNYLGNMHFICDKPVDECTVCALQDLAYWYWNDRHSNGQFPENAAGGVVDDLDRAVKQNCKPPHWFSGFLKSSQQGDPTEFMRVLLDALESHEHENKKRLDRMTQLIFVERGVCSACGHEPPNKQVVGGGLQLPLTDPVTGKAVTRTLEEHIGKLFESEVEAICESDECRAVKQLKEDQDIKSDPVRDVLWTIDKAPDMLWIELKCFNELGQKLACRVDYEEVLDLSEHTEDYSQLRYRLYGVVAHSGRTTRSGHYIAAVRNVDGRSFSTINDSAVDCTSDRGFAALQRPRSGHSSFQPYCLLYMRLDRPRSHTDDQTAS